MRDQQQQRAVKASALSAHHLIGRGPLRVRLLLAAIVVSLSGCDTMSSAIDSVTPRWVGDETPYAGNVAPKSQEQRLAQQPVDTVVSVVQQPVQQASSVITPPPVQPAAPLAAALPVQTPTALGAVPAYVPDSLRYRNPTTNTVTVPLQAAPVAAVAPAFMPAQGATARAALGLEPVEPAPVVRPAEADPVATSPPAAVASAATAVVAAAPSTEPLAGLGDLGGRVVYATRGTSSAPVIQRPVPAAPDRLDESQHTPQLATLDDLRGRIINSYAAAPAGQPSEALAGRIITPGNPSAIAPNLADVPPRPADMPSATLQQQRIVAMQAQQADLQQQQVPTAPPTVAPALAAQQQAPTMPPVALQHAGLQQAGLQQGALQQGALQPVPPQVERLPATPVQQPVQVAQISSSVPSGVNSAFQRALQQSAPNRFQPVPPMQQPLTPSAVPQSIAAQPRVLQVPTPQALPPTTRPGAPATVGRVHFESDSAQLRPAELIPLGQLAQRLRQQGGKVRVIGYAPRTGRGDPTDLMLKSFQLSVDRADAVARKLMELGVPAAQIAVEGKGADVGAAAQADTAHANRVDLLPGT